MNRHAPLYRWATLTIVVCTVLAGCASPPRGEAPYQYRVYGCDRNGEEAQRRAC